MAKKTPAKPKKSTRNAKPQRMPKGKAKPKSTGAPGPTKAQLEADRKRLREIDQQEAAEAKVMRDEMQAGLLEDIKHAEQEAFDAILQVATDVDLAASLADASPKFMTMGDRAGEFVTLEYLTVLAVAGNGPEQQKDMNTNPWPKLCDGDGRVTTRRGRAQRKVPARDLLKWFRGDPDVLKPRQTRIPESDEVAEVAEKGGAKHYIRKRKSHTFEAEDYTVTMTEGQLSKFRGDMSGGRRLRVIDQKMRLKKEVDEFPGNEHRAEEMKALLGIILVDAADAEEE